VVIGAALVLAFAALYVAGHAGGRGPELGPTALAAAPASARQVTRSPARPAGRAAPPTVSTAWVATFAARTGIPARALTAYADASLRAPCPLGWTTLAAIGWVESGHGTVDGQQVDADGRTVAPILGPVLDGRGKVAAVPGAGGDWARATGPMQFLDSTWARWGSDGDGDGVADPQDLDDAAYAAAWTNAAR
jgi:membrane-bound lytic murein transglycosylase B